MKLYKFRGRDMNKKMRYGSLVQEFKKFGEERIVVCVIVEKAGTRAEENYYVDNNSVAQLIGYDESGFEVYEGDDARIVKTI